MGLLGVAQGLCSLMRAREISKWLLDMSKHGWKMEEMHDDKPKPKVKYVPEDEFIACDLMRNMMILTILVFAILTKIGKIGHRVVHCPKVDIGKKAFFRSCLLLIPFGMMLVGIKAEARKFKALLHPPTEDFGMENQFDQQDYQRGYSAEGRQLQSFRMPQQPPMMSDEHSQFAFNANVNGREFHLDLENPDFNELGDFMGQMMNGDLMMDPNARDFAAPQQAHKEQWDGRREAYRMFGEKLWDEASQE
jgi:hypothetical protein